MSQNPIIPIDNDDALTQFGQAANAAAARHVFEDFRSRRSENTLRAHDADLTLFAAFLAEAGIAAERDFAHDPDAWRGITWGLAQGFVNWMLNGGYAIGSVNRRLSTVKRYAGLAFKAGVLSHNDHALIKTVTGYSHKEGLRLDEKREEAGVATRVGDKKVEAVRISDKQALALKRDQPATPQGRRDALLLSLLLDLGLRCGEVAGLLVEHVDLGAGELKFYRPKVDKEQTHRMSPDVQAALVAWVEMGDVPASGALLRGSRKGGKLTEAGMSVRAITDRVRVLGERVGIDGLSAHDCRHYWATKAARSGTDPFALQEAGGWNSLAMPRRYVEAAKIANEGVKLE